MEEQKKNVDNENRNGLSKVKSIFAIVIEIITAVLTIYIIFRSIRGGISLSFEMILLLMILLLIGVIDFYDYVKVGGLLELKKTNEDLKEQLNDIEIKNNNLFANMMKISVSNNNTVVVSNIQNSVQNPLLVEQKDNNKQDKVKNYFDKELSENAKNVESKDFSEKDILEQYLKDNNIPQYTLSFEKKFSDFFSEINPLSRVRIDAYYKYNNEECFLEVKRINDNNVLFLNQIKEYIYSIYLYNSLRKVNAKLVLILSGNNADMIRTKLETTFNFELSKGFLDIKYY